MLLLTLLLISAVLAVEDGTIIETPDVTITDDTLINATTNQSSLLNLSGLGLRKLAENAFENSTTLKNLDLGNNLLSSIPKQIFSKLENLEHLSLANNKVTNLEIIFQGLDNLKTLNISNNPLDSLQATALSGLSKSSIVYTKGLSLQSISAFVFENETATTFTTSKLKKKSITNNLNPIRQTQEQHGSAKMRSRRNGGINKNRLIKICIQRRVIKKVQLSANTTLGRNCHEALLTESRNILFLTDLGIEKFEKNWYRLRKRTPINRIVFRKNNIRRVTPEFVNDLPKTVRHIDLLYNKIERLKSDILNNPNIVWMDFSSNAISRIKDNAFTNMIALNYLRLDTNMLSNTRFMATLPTLIQTLSLSNNKITEISPRLLATTSNLKTLFLDRNLIQAVKADSFNGLPHLKYLELSDNCIAEIEPESFQRLSNIVIIALNNNSIDRFKIGTFDNLRKLKTLEVSSNKLSNIKKSFPNGLPQSLGTLFLDSNELKTLKSNDFKNVSLRSLLLSGNNISKIEHGALELSTLRTLKLDHNKLSRLDAESFRGLNNMVHLTLNNNNITRIPKGFTRNMHSLDILDLSYNPIRRLQNGALHGFRKSDSNNVFLWNVPIEILEAGLFDDM